MAYSEPPPGASAVVAGETQPGLACASTSVDGPTPAAFQLARAQPVSRGKWRAQGAAEARETQLAADLVAASGIRVEVAGRAGLLPYLDVFGIDVRLSDLPRGMMGRTTFESGPVIEVSASASRSRKLFTIAHELGHFLLEEASFHPSFRGRLPRTYEATEWLCDRVGGQLLLPDRWLTTDGCIAIRSAALTKASYSMGVSRDALVRRFCELGWQALSLQASRDRAGVWRLDCAYGGVCGKRPEDLALQDALSAVGNEPVRLRGDGSKRPLRMPEGVYGEIFRKGDQAWMWLASPDAPSSLCQARGTATASGWVS